MLARGCRSQVLEEFSVGRLSMKRESGFPGFGGQRVAVLDTPASFGLDVPDDARFARYSPGRSLRLAPGAVVGATRPIAGRAGFARERPGRCAPIQWLAT